jgi:hypothetical protein
VNVPHDASTGTAEVSDDSNAPTDNRDESSLSTSHPETAEERGRSRRRTLPAGDSVTLRIARRFGLR